MAAQTRQTGLAHLPDGVLAARAADGDHEAFRIVLSRHESLLRAYVTRLVRSSADADDIVQEVFVLAWRRLPELRNPEVVRAWLMTIAGRQAIGHLRRRTRDTPLDQIADPPTLALQPEARVIRDAQIGALAVVLDGLPELQRQSWLLREMAGLSYQEIADELEVPASTVRGALARARTSILAQMEAWR